MGKCMSCCKTPGQPGSLRYSTGQSARPSDGHNLGRILQPQVQKDTKVTPPPTESQYQLGSTRPPLPPPDKKMFTQYPKLPPIKKQSSGESKRLSLISREYSETKIHTLFEQYKDPGEDAILAEGIEKFCNDLDVKPDEFIVLVLAWKFQAETMCRFTRDEFINGCKTLKVDSVKSIQSKFSELLSEVQNKQSFKDLYRWTYKFGLDVDTNKRTLPVEMAIGLWKLVFSQREPAILERWLSFLEKHATIRGIPRDTWDMFLNFTEQVGDDLSSYDDTEAWPSLLDDFVEYENDCQNQNVKPD